MTDHMPIGRDIDLLCAAVTIASARIHISQRTVQRYVRTGPARARRLLLLMDDYGITDGRPAGRWESRAVLITGGQLAAVLAGLREIASRESGAPRA